jgi:hypothetical protein
VSVVAASLPALLELSVILFMAGLPIFLYSPSLPLSIVIIVIAGTFLGICAAATVLPALTKDFPYKNPVAWGFHKLVTECRRLYATLRTQKWRYRGNSEPGNAAHTKLLPVHSGQSSLGYDEA